MIDPLDQNRLKHGAGYLHARGPRFLAEFLAENATDLGGIARLLDRLEQYKSGVSAEVFHLVSGERFSNRALRLVPRDLGEDMP